MDRRVEARARCMGRPAFQRLMSLTKTSEPARRLLGYFDSERLVNQIEGQHFIQWNGRIKLTGFSPTAHCRHTLNFLVDVRERPVYGVSKNIQI